MVVVFASRGFVQPASQGDDPMYLLSTRRQGTWADSETERALKSLHSFCKNYGGIVHFIIYVFVKLSLNRYKLS